MADDLTLGVALALPGAPASQYVEDARHAATLGFDVIELADHLGLTAPLPTLVAIAAATPNVRVTNYVLNTSFYRPHLLARDVGAVHELCGGRFILSLGTGYVEGEFIAAGIPFPAAGQRVHAIEEMVRTVRELLDDPNYVPLGDVAPPLVRIAGRGDRLLAVAAQHADIVLLDPTLDRTQLVERIDYVRARTGHRAERPKLGFGFLLAFEDNDDLSAVRVAFPGLSDDEIRALPGVLHGTIDGAVAAIEWVRRLGIDYVTFLRTPGVSWDVLEHFVGALRR